MFTVENNGKHEVRTIKQNCRLFLYLFTLLVISHKNIFNSYIINSEHLLHRKILLFYSLEQGLEVGL